MSQLTFRIRPNDEVTLKEDLQCYVNRTEGFSNTFIRKDKRKGMCTDPDYILDFTDMLNFRGKTVVVEYTCLKHRFDNDGHLLGSYYYITVRNRTGDSFECPIEFIDKSYILK